MASFYDISHPDVFVHLRNATQELASTIPQANILLSNVVSARDHMAIKRRCQPR